jgi:hypothetical protein
MIKSKIEIGQTVYLKPLNNAARRSSEIIESVVTKVGKKYFNVSPEYLRRFSLDTMLQDCGNWTAEYKAYLSKQEILDEREKYELYDYLRKTYFDMYSRKNIKLETLRAIREVLNKEQGDAVSDTTMLNSSTDDDNKK